MPTLMRPTLSASATSIPLARWAGTTLTTAATAFARFVICPLESWYLIARIPTEHTRSFGTAPPRSPLPSRFRPAFAAAKACLSVGGLPRTKTEIFPAISSNGRSTAAHGRRYTRASTAVTPTQSRSAGPLLRTASRRMTARARKAPTTPARRGRW